MREQRLRVKFAVDDCAVAAMTWGQQAIWRPLQWFGKETAQFNMSRWFAVPAGVDRPRFLRTVRTLIERQQSLRTQFVDGDQHIVGQGSIEVMMIVDHGADPLAPAEALAEAMAADHIDLTVELPIRIAAVATPAGQVAAVALVVSHVALDGWAMDALVRDLLVELAGTPARPPSGGVIRNPLDQLAFERSPLGSRVSASALAHWTAGLESAPASLFDFPPVDAGPRPVEQYVFESDAIPMVAPILSARSRTSVSTVLLTLAALLLRAYVGHDTIALKLIVGNRFNQDQRALRAPAAQDGMLVLRWEDGDLITAMRQTFPAAIRAYLNGRYDPSALAAEQERIEWRRGVHLDISSYFNDSRPTEWINTRETEPDRATLDRLCARSSFRKVAEYERHDMTFYINVGEAAPRRCRLLMRADTRQLPPPVGELILRGIEKLMCIAVHNRVETQEIPRATGIVPVRRGPGWVRTAAGWASPVAVAEVLGEVCPGHEVAVFHRPSPAGSTFNEFIAYVAVEKPTDDLTLGATHRQVMERLRHRVGAAAPDWYVLVAGSPPASGTMAAWARMPVLASESGRDR